MGGWGWADTPIGHPDPRSVGLPTAIILTSRLTTAMVSGPDGQPTARLWLTTQPPWATIMITWAGERERERVGVIVYAVDTKGWLGATLAVSHERGADVKEADMAVTPPALGAPTQFCVIQGNAADRA